MIAFARAGEHGTWAERARAGSGREFDQQPRTEESIVCEPVVPLGKAPQPEALQLMRVDHLCMELVSCLYELEELGARSLSVDRPFELLLASVGEGEADVGEAEEDTL
jgi:hypothetical protein